MRKILNYFLNKVGVMLGVLGIKRVYVIINNVIVVNVIVFVWKKESDI